MRRLYKSLLWAAAIEAVAWAIGTTGPPSGFHVEVFIWMHFVPAFLSLVSPVFASAAVMTITQFGFWTALTYFLYAAFERHRIAEDTDGK